MGTPADHLPPPLSHASIEALTKSIGIPTPVTIISPKVTAQYHSIYMITIIPNEKFPYQYVVLRVSGPHIPKLKTENEAAIMTWVSINTTIPIPEVLSFDSSTNNPIGHEYILLSRAHGEPLSDIYQSLDQQQMDVILNQLIDILSQLHAFEWEAIGGLTFDDEGAIHVGPVLEETFWQNPDIERFWPGETMSTLNIRGPCHSYVDYISAHMAKYMYAIERHEKLAFMRDTLCSLDEFLKALAVEAEELNKVKLRLAHKDLHFANIIFDRNSGKITAILDWEFSGVVPFTRWNPTRAFLWNGQENADSLEEKQRLLARFTALCAAREVTLLQDAEFVSVRQEAMQLATNYLRAIVEVAPRDQKQDCLREWKEKLFEQIAVHHLRVIEGSHW